MWTVMYARWYESAAIFATNNFLHRAESTSASTPCATENIVSSVPQVLKIPFTEEPEEEPRYYSGSDVMRFELYRGQERRLVP